MTGVTEEQADGTCPTVVLLTRTDPANCYIACQLAASRRLCLVAIVTEDRRRGQWQLLKKKIRRAWRQQRWRGVFTLGFAVPWLYWYDRRTVHLQQRTLWGHARPQFPAGVRHEAFPSLNTDAVERLLHGLCPDFLLVSGTCLLEPRIFGRAKEGALNLHMGITPEYRGSRGEFWALSRGDFQNVGLTVHRIDTGIDTGVILLQRRLSVAPEDNERTLRIKNIQVAASLFEEAVVACTTGSLSAVESHGRVSRFFSTPMPWQVWKMRCRRSWARCRGKQGTS